MKIRIANKILRRRSNKKFKRTYSLNLKKRAFVLQMQHMIKRATKIYNILEGKTKGRVRPCRYYKSFNKGSYKNI